VFSYYQAMKNVYRAKQYYLRSMLSYKLSGLASLLAPVTSHAPWGLLRMPRSFQRPPTEYDNQVFRLILELAPKGICIDAGSWIGDIAILMARTARRVIALEPDRYNIRFLQKNIKLNNFESIIEPLPYALSEKDGTIMLVTSSSSAGHSTNAWLGAYHYPVQSISINKLILEYLANENEIDLVEMDVQRAEFQILPSANAEIFYRVKNWLVECHGEGETKAEEERLIEQLFRSHGYYIRWLEPPAAKDKGRHIYAYRY
jgi:FkbM family methyltransferase